jgi:ubiquinone/menaquinone biosynthesis C-methylase UbiE
VRRFRYGLDPVCILACAAYALNRWLFKSVGHSVFLHGTFNDLLLIPAALPLVLWLQRKLAWRTHDLPPTPGEIFSHWLVWSVVCEGVAPLFLPRAVGSLSDVAAYAAGALVAGVWWNRRFFLGQNKPPSADFDVVSPHYDWMEAMLAGDKLRRCREAFLADIPPPRHALLAGEGHGRFLAALLAKYPDTRVTCLDSSAGMLGVARNRILRRCLPADRVTFLQKDLLEWIPAEGEFDFIATHFFLDCFSRDQLSTIVPRLARSASPGARWMVADFQLPSGGRLRRIRAGIILWLMYRFFRIVTRLPAAALEPPAPLLTQHSFVSQQRQEYDWGLLYAELWRRDQPRVTSSASGQ